MQVDPKFTFWFGVWTNVLLFSAAYGLDHAPALVLAYAPSVQWALGFFGKLNGVILTALVGISSAKVGPFVAGSK